MPTNEEKTRYRKIRERAEDNPVHSALMFLVLIFIGLGAIAGAYSNILQVLPTRVPQMTASLPAGSPTTGAATSPANPSPAAPNEALFAEWIGTTNTGGTLRLNIKQAGNSQATISLQAIVQLPAKCSNPPIQFSEKVTAVIDATGSGFTASSKKLEMSAQLAEINRDQGLTGQMTLYLGTTGDTACTSPQFNFTAQKAR